MDNDKLPISKCDTLNYRGIDVDFYSDDYGRQVYSYLDGIRIDFGTCNTSYKDDMKKIIDQKLDLIKLYPELPGMKLEYFQNGSFRDIHLVYKFRELQVYLIHPKEVGDKDTENIITFQADKFVSEYIKENNYKDLIG